MTSEEYRAIKFEIEEMIADERVNLFLLSTNPESTAKCEAVIDAYMHCLGIIRRFKNTKDTVEKLKRKEDRDGRSH